MKKIVKFECWLNGDGTLKEIQEDSIDSKLIKITSHWKLVGHREIEIEEISEILVTRETIKEAWIKCQFSEIRLGQYEKFCKALGL